jgi:hypothetical protein
MIDRAAGSRTPRLSSSCAAFLRLESAKMQHNKKAKYLVAAGKIEL